MTERDLPRGAPISVDIGVSLKDLALYEQAATQTGYQIFVTAREGELRAFSTNKVVDGNITNVKVQNTVKIPPEHVAVSIERPQSQRDHSPFWDAYRALKATPKQ